MLFINANLYSYAIFLFLLIKTADCCSSSDTEVDTDTVYIPITSAVNDKASIVSLRLLKFHICTGTIISTIHILTSAYCVCSLQEEGKKALKIVSGVSTTEQNGTDYTVKNIICHSSVKQGPSYETSDNADMDIINTFRYDTSDIVNVALIEINEVINFGSEQKNIILPFNLKEPKTSNNCFLVGWNLALHTFEIKNQPLQALQVTTLSRSECVQKVSANYTEQYVNNYLECLVKKQYDPNLSSKPRKTIKSYPWIEFGAPYICDGVLMGIMNFPFTVENWVRTDKQLYTIVRIESIHEFLNENNYYAYI